MDRKTALVTGASRGLGLTLSRLLAQTGHDLVITARGADALESASRSLESYGGSVLAFPGDVSDPEHRRRLIEATASAFGKLDVLINNASTLGTSPLPSMTEYPLDDLEQVLRVNLLAPLGLTQEALPLLIKGHGLV
jgi:NAD(P)-dependent dehydrogenase (short-subunit alcohol dehydrogenase family)